MNEPKSPEKKKSRGKPLTSTEKIAASIAYLESTADTFFFIGFEKDTMGFRYSRQTVRIWSFEIALDLLTRIRDDDEPREKIDPKDKDMKTQIATIDSFKIPYFYINFAYERSINYQYKLSGIRREYLAMTRRMFTTFLEVEVGQWHIRTSTPASAPQGSGIARLDDGLVQ